jgi:ATP-binding protein involved in chromosome partitioning
MNPNVRVGGDSGKPIIVSDPEADAAKALRAVAEAVAARVSVAALTGNDAPTINVI